MPSDTSLCNLKLSTFAQCLVPEEKQLYCHKLKELGCVDPLSIPLGVYKSGKNMKEVLPPITYQHLVLYLVIERNGSDGEKFEAFKNLNASRQYVDNTFADKLLAFPLPNGIVIIRSHITHSQSLTVNPTTPWAALHSDGKVNVGYCDCAAGLGRVCIHVSALLQLAVAKHELPSVRTSWNADEQPVAPTSKPCEWNKPSKGPVTVGKVGDLSVIKKRKHANVVNVIPPLTDGEYNQIIAELAELPFLPVCLSNITEYSGRFKSLAETHNVPNHLTELFNPEFEGKPDVVVNEECERIFQTISFSKADQEAVEIATRDQSAVSEWKNQRAGRITGTKIKRVFNFKFPSQPTRGDINFILEMCYPELNNFTGNKSTRYGLKNEPIAAKVIEKHIKDTNLHTNFSLKPVGFVIATSTPYVGASPDRLTECDCCGRCVLEIKCPSTLQGKDIDERVKVDKSFFLQIHPETKEIYLVKNHDYYFQFQLQLYVTESRKGIFGVYNGAGEIKLVHIERDEDLISTMVAKSKLFFLTFLLPELVSKRYSSVKNASFTAPATNIIAANINDNRNQFICDCQDPLKEDEIVRCAGEFCMFQEFHKTCTKSKRFPDDWTCVYCKKEAAKKKREEAKKREEEKKKTEDSSANQTNPPLVTSQAIPMDPSLVSSSAIRKNLPLVTQPGANDVVPVTADKVLDSSKGLNHGTPVAINVSNQTPLVSIKDKATVFATRERLPRIAKPNASIISRISLSSNLSSQTISESTTKRTRSRQKQQKENDPDYHMVPVSNKENTKRQATGSLEEADLTLKRSNASSGLENAVKKMRGRPRKTLTVVNI